MPRPIERTIRLIHASTDDLAIFNKDAAYWRLIALEGKLGL